MIHLPISLINPVFQYLEIYNPKFIRPLESSTQQLSSDFLAQASPKLRQLLGYEFQASIFKDVLKLQANHSNELE